MPYDPSITQKVASALRDLETTTFIERQLLQAIQNVERRDDDLEKRVRMLEIANAERITETGVQRTIELKTAKPLEKLRSSVGWLSKLFWILLLGMLATDLWLRSAK